MNNRPIGIFDSGVGGLTVVKSIRKCLPNEDIVYFGDTARVPYGNKSKDTVIRFAHEIMAFLMEKKVKMVIVACNTASSLSLAALKRSYDVPVVGVISPGVRDAVKMSKKKRVGVIGTSSTIASKAYDREILKIDPSFNVFSKACPLFVPLVENRFINDDITRQVALRYLEGMRKRRIDTLILGCTHYPILKKVIAETMDGTDLVDSPLAVAKEADDILSKKDMKAGKGARKGKMKCFVSDDVNRFKSIAGIFLKEKVSVKKAVL